MLQLLGVALTLLLLAISALYFYLTWHFEHWTRRQVPGPLPRPLYGTFPGTVSGKRNFIYDLDEVYRQFKGKSKFVGVFTTRNPQLMILDPALAKEMLTTNFKCFQDNESSKWMNRQLEPISGNNPFVLPAAEWKEKRAEIVPGLTQSKIKGMYPLILNIGQKLIKYLKRQLKAGETIFDAKDFSLRYTGEVVADVVWGIEAGTLNAQPYAAAQPECTFLSMSKRMIAQTFYAFTYFFIVGIFPILRRCITVRFYPEITDRFFLNLTHLACEMRSAMSGESARQDFLQHLLELRQKKQLTETQMLAHMLTFHFDGFETSATLISHTLLLLARTPEAQHKLRCEILECQAQSAGNIPFEELMRLPYLEQCIAETLRIFTPLPFMSKICTEACELDNGDGVRLQLCPGDICLISLHSFHHDGDYYVEPESFMPERFAAESGGSRPYKDEGVYMPFGDGPRICLGMKFAQMQSKAAIVEIIKHFEVSVSERTRKDNWQGSRGFITGLEGGIFLQLKARAQTME